VKELAGRVARGLKYNLTARGAAALVDAGLVPRTKRWLFGAFVGRAFADNAAALFRHVCKHRPDIDAAFVLDPDCPDWAQAARVGPVLNRGSARTTCEILGADVVVMSHGLYDLPGFERALGLRVRVGHGLTGLKRTRPPALRSQQYVGSLFDLVPVASPFERENKREWRIREENLEVLGVCRFDELRALAREHQAPRQVLWLPTWRDDTADSARCIAAMRAFLHHKELHALLQRVDHELVVVPHRRFRGDLAAPPGFQRVRVVQHVDVQRALAAARVLVTDYSGVAWDMLQLRRPVVFFAPDLDRYQRARGLHLDLRGDPPGRFADNPDDAVRALADALDHGFDERGARWAERAMSFHDEGNCARVLAAIERRLHADRASSDESRRGWLVRS
jgi:CDP-glycerol glycerophosphotransferase (TagB/SpsB family)